MKTFTWHRIKAVVIRTLLRYKHNAMAIIETIFWPILDIIIWGTMSVWLAQNAANLPYIAVAILTGLVFWEMTIRSIYEISITMIREIYSKSLMTLFTTPLTVGEWIVGLMISSLVRVLASLAFCSFIVWIMYATNIFGIGWMFIPFSISLTIFGWAIGFLGAGFIIYWGMKVEALPWMSLWALAPFSAVYYPVSALPAWMQFIAKMIPSSYIFEGMRLILSSNIMPWNLLLTSLALNALYLTSAIAFFVFMFNKSKEKGLARL